MDRPAKWHLQPGGRHCSVCHGPDRRQNREFLPRVFLRFGAPSGRSDLLPVRGRGGRPGGLAGSRTTVAHRGRDKSGFIVTKTEQLRAIEEEPAKVTAGITLDVFFKVMLRKL